MTMCKRYYDIPGFSYNYDPGSRVWRAYPVYGTERLFPSIEAKTKEGIIKKILDGEANYKIDGISFSRPGHELKFDELGGIFALYGPRDQDFEYVLKAVERVGKIRLERQDRTDWPAFTHYIDGEEVGGG